ncbi:hypothetical protein [Methylobacterium sp. JK268]
MNRLRRAVGPPLLVLTLAAASAAPAATGRAFDGTWAVVATTESGTCAGPYRYPIVIRDGIVDDAGGTGVDASGRAGADGRITGAIRQGLASITVTGRLRAAAGTGRWSLAGPVPCAGRWRARRTG